MATDYDIGDGITVTANFVSAAGAATDPSAVTFKLRTPAGVETSYAYPSAQVTKSATGIYVFAVPPFAAVGGYAVRAVGTGTVAAAAEQDLTIRPTQFTSP